MAEIIVIGQQRQQRREYKRELSLNRATFEAMTATERWRVVGYVLMMVRDLTARVDVLEGVIEEENPTVS